MSNERFLSILLSAVLLSTLGILLVTDLSAPTDFTNLPSSARTPEASPTPRWTGPVTPIGDALIKVTPIPTRDPDHDSHTQVPPPADCGPWSPSHVYGNMTDARSFIGSGTAGLLSYDNPTPFFRNTHSVERALVPELSNEHVVWISGEAFRQSAEEGWEHAYDDDWSWSQVHDSTWPTLDLLRLGTTQEVGGTRSSAGCSYAFQNDSPFLPAVMSVTYDVEPSGRLASLTVDGLGLTFDYETRPVIDPPIDMSKVPADCGDWNTSYLLDGMLAQPHWISQGADPDDTTYFVGPDQSMATPPYKTDTIFRRGDETWIMSSLGVTRAHWFDVDHTYAPPDWASQMKLILGNRVPNRPYRARLNGTAGFDGCVFQTTSTGIEYTFYTDHEDRVIRAEAFHDDYLHTPAYVTTFDYDTIRPIDFPKDSIITLPPKQNQ